MAKKSLHKRGWIVLFLITRGFFYHLPLSFYPLPTLLHHLFLCKYYVLYAYTRNSPPPHPQPMVTVMVRLALGHVPQVVPGHSLCPAGGVGSQWPILRHRMLTGFISAPPGKRMSPLRPPPLLYSLPSPLLKYRLFMSYLIPMISH